MKNNNSSSNDDGTSRRRRRPEKSTRASSCLYLAVDPCPGAGGVWYAGPRSPAAPSGAGVEAFLRHGPPAFREARSVRLTGSPHAHARLITELYRRRVRGQLDSVQVCSPLSTRDDRPATALLRVMVLDAPPSLGGWHEVLDLDAASYRLASWHHGGGPREQLDDHGLLRKHPLYRYLTFLACPLPRGCEEALARIIAEVADPRWWLRPGRPDSRDELYEHFGLASRPPPDAGGLDRQAARSRLSLLCEVVLGALTPARGGSPFRSWLAERGARPPLESARLFLDYLCGVWLDRASFTHRGKLFCPRLFFGPGHPELAAAWRQHVRSRPNGYF